MSPLKLIFFYLKYNSLKLICIKKIMYLNKVLSQTFLKHCPSFTEPQFLMTNENKFKILKILSFVKNTYSLLKSTIIKCLFLFCKTNF